MPKLSEKDLEGLTEEVLEEEVLMELVREGKLEVSVDAQGFKRWCLTPAGKAYVDELKRAEDKPN